MPRSTPPRRPHGWDEYQAASRRMFDKDRSVLPFKQYQLDPSDVFIAPFSKSGTTWLQQIVHSLRTGGDTDYDDISRVVPWFETAGMAGIDVNAPQRAQPRAFKSHLPYNLIPKGARYIVSLRDPADALVSLYHFMSGWFFEPGTVTLEELAEKRFLIRRENEDYWHHLLSWWQQRDNPAVLLMAYEHMKADPEAVVHRVARFLELPVDEERLAIAVQQSSFDVMRANKDKYDDKIMRAVSEQYAGLPPGSESSKVRTGRVGDASGELSPATLSKIEEIWREHVTPATGAIDYASLIAELSLK